MMCAGNELRLAAMVTGSSLPFSDWAGEECRREELSRTSRNGFDYLVCDLRRGRFFQSDHAEVVASVDLVLIADYVAVKVADALDTVTRDGANVASCASSKTVFARPLVATGVSPSVPRGVTSSHEPHRYVRGYARR